MSALNFDLLTYNALDCACTTEIHPHVMKDLDPQGYRWAYDFTMSLYEPLMYMQTRGIKVNFTNLEITKDDINKKRDEAQEELNRLCGRPLNANSPKQVQQYFYVEKGIAPYYDGQSVTTNDKAMQRIARGTAKHKGLREARLIQDIRGYVKLYSTYLDIDFDSDGRLRCAYNPRGTKFGRLSSSETVFGTGTNLQNLPQEFKKFLVPDEGYFFWEVDKRQAEWIVVAYLSGDANMLSVIERGEDPHTHTAHLMFRLDKDIIVLDNKLVSTLNDPEEIQRRRDLAGLPAGLPRTMSGRQMGKKSNHGLNYDEGFNTFALSNEIEIPESKRVINLYHSIYPGIRLWHEGTKRQLASDRSLTNCFGRRIRFLDAWSDDLFKAAYSAVPQSTVGDNTNMGMRDIYNDHWICSPSGRNIDLLANVHDSCLLQVPISALHAEGDLAFDKVIQRVYTHMEPELEYNGRKFKIPTDSKFGFNWGAYHPDANDNGMKEIHQLADLKEYILGGSGAH